MLEIKNGGFFYGKENFLFKELSLDVKKGEIVAILGRNGVGKSTLLSCILGVNSLKSGEMKKEVNAAFLPQSFYVAFDYKVLDIVLMGRVGQISLFSKPSKDDIQISCDALDTLGLLHVKDKSFNSLSGGQKQMVLFARAIASGSELLLLDEPASALDITNQDRVLTLIKSLNLTTIFTTHQPNHALAIADKCLVLMKECRYVFGKSEDVLSEELLGLLYGVDMKNIYLNYNNKQIRTSVALFGVQK